MEAGIGNAEGKGIAGESAADDEGRKIGERRRGRSVDWLAVESRAKVVEIVGSSG